MIRVAIELERKIQMNALQGDGIFVKSLMNISKLLVRARLTIKRPKKL